MQGLVCGKCQKETAPLDGILCASHSECTNSICKNCFGKPVEKWFCSNACENGAIVVMSSKKRPLEFKLVEKVVKKKVTIDDQERKAAAFDQIKELVQANVISFKERDTLHKRLKYAMDRLKIERSVSSQLSEENEKMFAERNKTLAEAEATRRQIRTKLDKIYQQPVDKIDHHDTALIHESTVKLADLQKKILDFERLDIEKQKALQIVQTRTNECKSLGDQIKALASKIDARITFVRSLCGINE